MCHVTSSDQWQVVKSLSLSLGLPTVTTTMGEEGDISEWAELSSQQAQYLVQVTILNTGLSLVSTLNTEL